MVWVKFCHTDSNARQARYRETSRVEIKLSQKQKAIDEQKAQTHD